MDHRTTRITTSSTRRMPGARSKRAIGRCCSSVILTCRSSFGTAARPTTDSSPKGERDVTLRLEEDARHIINPGSVGQPRDGDPRAAFAIYETEGPSLTLRRIPYAVDAAQRRILGAGLPASLANRLAVGR